MNTDKQQPQRFPEILIAYMVNVMKIQLNIIMSAGRVFFDRDNDIIAPQTKEGFSMETTHINY